MQDIAEILPIRFPLQGHLAVVCRTGWRILFLALLPICLLASPGIGGDLRDTPANRYQAAEAYLNVYPLDAMMDEITGEILEVMPQQYHETFREVMKDSMNRVNLKELTINAIVKHFTVEEINALAEFYGSP